MLFFYYSLTEHSDVPSSARMPYSTEDVPHKKALLKETEEREGGGARPRACTVSSWRHLPPVSPVRCQGLGEDQAVATGTGMYARTWGLGSICAAARGQGIFYVEAEKG